MSVRGIRIKHLKDALAQFGVTDLTVTVADAARTIQASVNANVPATAPDLLALLDASWVDDARVAPLYLWSNSVAAIVDTLTMMYESHTAVWLDLLYVPHATRTVSVDEWIALSRQIFGATRRICLILAERHTLALLQRAWTLADLMVALQCDAVVDCTVLASERAAFLADLIREPQAVITDMIGRLQCTPICASTRDYAAIDRAIDTFDGGLPKLRAALVDRLQAWFRTTLETESRTRPEDMVVRLALAALYHYQGNFAAAVTTLEARPMPSDPNWLCALGAAYQCAGDFVRADERLTAALTFATDPADRATLRVQLFLAIVRQHQHRDADAEALLHACIANCPSAEHSYALNCRMNLGILYAKQGKLTDAKQTFIECGDAFARYPEHRSEMYTCMYQLASCHQQEQAFDAAEPLLTACLRGREQIFGTTHVTLVNTLGSLAYNYDAQKRLPEALETYNRCWTLCARLAGERHPITLTYLYNCALTQERSGQYAVAEELYLNCYQLRKAALGDRHLDTVAAAEGYADVLNAQNKLTYVARLLLTFARDVRKEAAVAAAAATTCNS